MNFNNHRMITLIASVVLVIAFFMPWISVGGLFSVSAWDLLTGRFEENLPWQFFLLFLVPGAALLLLIQKLASKTNVRFLYFLPLLALIGLFTYGYIEYQRSLSVQQEGIDISARINGEFLSAFMDVVAFGFWLTIILSVVLFILGCIPARRTSHFELSGERTENPDRY